MTIKQCVECGQDFEAHGELLRHCPSCYPREQRIEDIARAVASAHVRIDAVIEEVKLLNGRIHDFGLRVDELERLNELVAVMRATHALESP